MLFFRRSHVLPLFALSWMLSFCTTAQGGSSVLIWPIDPVLEADQQASALWLENRGNEAANLQIRVFAWSQNGFEEHYDNQHDVIGSPPVARIEPGQKQLVRLTRTREVPAGQEQAYRVIIDEIPSATPATAAAGQSAAAVRFQMRYSVPLFAYGQGLWSKEDLARKRDPKDAGQPNLSWRKVQVAGQPYVEIRNQGAVHARLTDVSFKQGGQNRQLVEGLLGYVLPGAVMRWPAPPQLAADQPLQVRVNGLNQTQDLSPSH
jgi:fimbrial chaperone protein